MLAEAGARDADMLIACAALDETNLVVLQGRARRCSTSRRASRACARRAYKDDSPLLGKEGFAVDRVICPEESLTRYIGKLIEYPEALQVREFAGGLACLVAVRAVAGAPLVRHSIAELRELRARRADMRIVAIYRRSRASPTASSSAKARRASSPATRCSCWRRASTSARVLRRCTATSSDQRGRAHHDRRRRPRRACGWRGS